MWSTSCKTGQMSISLTCGEEGHMEKSGVYWSTAEQNDRIMYHVFAYDSLAV